MQRKFEERPRWLSSTQLTSELCAMRQVSPSFVLRALYIITTLLCILMVFWVLGIPATWKQGGIEGWSEVMAHTLP